MDKAALQELTLLPSDKVRNALNAGDFARALALCEDLPKEYVLMHKGLRIVVDLLLPYNEQVFRREQAAISERIKAAITAGDREGALRLLEEKRERQYRPIHDALIDFKASTYDYMLRHFGEQQLYDCQRQLVEGQRRGFESWEHMSVADFLRAATFIFALHLGKTTVTEDDEKYTVTLDPCGTGLKMARTGQVEPEGRHARVATPQPMTFQRAGFPAYCAHCAVWNEIACIEWFGHSQWVFEPWQQPGDACRWFLYKDPNNIPAEHWTMFGFQKPANLPKPDPGAPLSAEELAGLGLTVSDKVRAALEAGDTAQALALAADLPKEYVLMVKGLGIVVKLLLEYNEQVFRQEQFAISERIRAAIAAGDAAQAIALLERKKRQHLDIHDVDIAFMATTFSWMYTAFGDQALHDCHYYLAEGQRRGFEAWEKLSPEEFLRATVFLVLLHSDGKYTVEEDEEKFTVISDPCGTGGKMQRDGLNDPPLSRYARVARPQPMTFSQPSFSTYCTHCAVWNSIAAIDWFGHPQWIQTPPRAPGDPCLLRIYKDPRNIPAEYYGLVGKEKPAG
jgi:hypothetical protein